MAVRILCVKKDVGDYENPYIAIDYFEWVNERINIKGITDRTKIHDWIKHERGEAYIIENGNKLFLIPAVSPKGHKYVKTVLDETVEDGLLLLPECV